MKTNFNNLAHAPFVNLISMQLRHMGVLFQTVINKATIIHVRK
jgi:hypothetical protein